VPKRYWEASRKMWTFPMYALDGMKTWFTTNKMQFKVSDTRSRAFVVVYDDKLVVDVDVCFISMNTLTGMPEWESTQSSPNDEARAMIVFSVNEEAFVNKILRVFDDAENYKYEMMLHNKEKFQITPISANVADIPDSQLPSQDEQADSPPSKRACRGRK
jgi:hypothetical protein